MKIYGRASSSNVQKVTWCCDELDIGYERIDMGREFGGNREAPYLAMNPNGTIPTIVEDDGLDENAAAARGHGLDQAYGPRHFATHRARGRGGPWLELALVARSFLGIA